MPIQFQRNLDTNTEHVYSLIVVPAKWSWMLSGMNFNL